MMTVRSVALANEFLRLPGTIGRLTQMQLQKLVYFADGWNWAINNTNLIDDQPEAWAYGPVYRDLYDHTKLFGRAPINRLIAPRDGSIARFFPNGDGDKEPYVGTLSGPEREVVTRVWSRYGALPGEQLSALTHQPETPWYLAFQRGKNSVISDEMIRDYYLELAGGAN